MQRRSLQQCEHIRAGLIVPGYRADSYQRDDVGQRGEKDGETALEVNVFDSLSQQVRKSPFL